MKTAFTADIHNHPSFVSGDLLNRFADEVRSEKPDLIILGGDIGETLADPELVRKVFQAFGGGAFVLGNHDLWCRSLSYSSHDLWDKILPEMGAEEGWHYLERENWIKNGIAVVGSYLHYDYSAADPEGAAVTHIGTNFPEWTTDEYYERMKKRVVNDAKYFKGLPRDKVFAEQIGEGFRKRLLDAEKDPEVHSIIVATHVPCMPSQITRKPQEWHWSCATAYFGNLSHTETIMGCSKVKYVFSGHSHQGNRATVEFHDGHEVEVINLDADYGKPTFELIAV